MDKFDIYVYAHWLEMSTPKLMGILSAHYAKGRKAFSFEYDKEWLKTESSRFLDPDIQFYSGPQFPHQKEGFGVFSDSMPDTWGRTLMKRKAVQEAKNQNKRTPVLYDIDYLLGVFDESRMGALRFKTSLDGSFLDNDSMFPIPPWSSIQELQYAAHRIETEDNDDEIQKWLAILVAPGTSLGGARPKANILDENKNLWIAKFPSQNDTVDKGAWEYLAYQLAIKAGIKMSDCRMEKIAGNHHTFLTRRFDRKNKKRIHFTSAMTMTGNNEKRVRDSPASYLEIAEFISNHCINIHENL